MKKSGTIFHSLRTTLLTLTLAFSAHSVIAEEIIFHNLNGYSFVGAAGEEARLVSFTTMLVRDGRVVATGDHGLLDLAPEAKQMNLHGRTVIPGLIDAHGHIQGLGQNLNQVDLRGIRSKAATVAQVANYADQNLELPWIVGRGWNQVLWPENSFPNREDLDSVISDRPIWLARIDSHAGWANSKALELAGITADTKSPAGGEIVKDENGNPTGILIDTAMALVEQQIPTPDEAALRSAYDSAFSHLLALGITQVHDAGVSARELTLLESMAEQGSLPIRIQAMIAGDSPELDNLLARGPYRDSFDRLQINSVKLYGDGALGSRGAALIEPYSDEPDNKGLLVTPADKVRSLFHMIHNAGFQINYHAIGDFSNRLALDTFAELAEEDEEAVMNRRHRIEHAQVVQVSDIPRFKALGVVPSMQPTHATSDMNMAEDRVGPDRIAGAYAWRTFLDQGSIIAAGSDFPVELANPFFGIHAAVTRQDRDNQPVEGWYPEQRMTLSEAIRGFTLDAAWAGHLEDTTGSIEPGKWADFIVVDQDPFHTPVENLWRIEVLATYVAGERHYKKEH
ncbi:MAG: putative metal-dependent hydrolase with the TIM-barrel fold [Idiomarinaceae bacterium HL-53]|nr:MAG: putative metal-dependent hydrolase with the TIM-barrel fold [Idiomarinaceae bacterium HL-53]CUS48392.1 hypothetical protein Ga0003345_1340 [Idiomarinaceae bacterium HL-53]